MSTRPRRPAHRVACAVVLTLVTVCATTAAQDRPDFSGRWVLEYASQRSPDVPRALSVQQTVARTNVRGELMTPYFRDIVVERELESGTRSETFVIGIMGGRVSGVVRCRPTARRHYAVSWDDDSLVFESGTQRDEPSGDVVWTERRKIWSLDAGRLRVTITNRRSGARPTTVTLVYRRP